MMVLVEKPPERVRYFDGQLLGVDDLRAEQEYHRSMRYLHNRLHGSGVASEVRDDVLLLAHVTRGSDGDLRVDPSVRERLGRHGRPPVERRRFRPRR